MRLLSVALFIVVLCPTISFAKVIVACDDGERRTYSASIDYNPNQGRLEATVRYWEPKNGGYFPIRRLPVIQQDNPAFKEVMYRNDSSGVSLIISSIASEPNPNGLLRFVLPEGRKMVWLFCR